MSSRSRIALGILMVCWSPALSPGAQEATSLWTWGGDYTALGRWNCPLGNDFVGIDAGDGHAIALRADGSIVCWGWSNHYGVLSDTPSGNDFTAITAGSSHNLALRSNGSIVSWGSCDSESRYAHAPPAGNDFVAIAGGSHLSIGLRSDGTLASSWDDYTVWPDAIPAGSDFAAIDAGNSYALALRTDGTIAAWGWDRDGVVSRAPVEAAFTAIAAGHSHSLALRADGSIAAWGSNEYGQCDAPAGNNFVAVSAGSAHSLALTADGSIVAWGSDSHGKISETPTEAAFTAIAAGHSHSVAIGPCVPRPAVTLDYTVVHLGNGLHGVTFTVRGGDVDGKSFFADLTFEGVNGGQIQQAQPFPGLNVDAEDDADVWSSLGEAAYDKSRDSYFLEPFSNGVVVVLEQGENFYHVEAGTSSGETFQDAPLAYICTSGDLRYEGTLARYCVNFPVSGVVDLPEPAAVAILAAGALALIRRRR